MCFFLCQAVRVLLTYFVYAPLRMLAFRDFQRLLCAELSLCFKHAPRLVLVFLDLCALIRVWSTFDKRYIAKLKRQHQKHGICRAFFLRQAARVLLTYLCTLRYACSPFSAFAVCSLASHLFASKKSSVQDAQQKHGGLPCFLI